MSIPNNRPGQGLPKGLPKRPNPNGGLPSRPRNNVPIPKNDDELPNLPDFGSANETPARPTSPRRERPEGIRGKQSDEYNYETGKAALRQKPSFKNEFDDEEDNTFEDLSIDEQLEQEEEEDQEARRREAKRKAADRRAELEAQRRRAERQAQREQALKDEEILFDEEDEDDELPDSLDEEDEVEDASDEAEDETQEKPKRRKKKDLTDENVKDEYGQDVFIDEKNMTLEPFGTKKGKKKKRKTKEHEYDHRKNMRTNSTIARFVFLGLFLFIVGLGVKNTFFPEPALTEEEITGIVAETADLTSFPVDEGGGFAKDFAQAYLSTDPEDSSTNESVLNYFYTGEVSADAAANTNRTFAGKYSQNVLYGPTVYESEALTDYSARYTIGAVVRSNTTTDPENPVDAKWVFLNVNVYYNEDADTFTVTPDSPAILPNPSVGSSEDLPTEMALGEEITDTDTIDKVQPVVYGFLNGYRQSSTEDHSTLDQYIIANPPVTLQQGLNNRYSFSGEGVEDSTSYNIYSDPEDPTLIKVKATVTWVDGTKDDNVNLTSTYVLFLREQDNGMYLVERFQPFYFVADEEEMAAEEEAAAEASADAEEE